MEIKEYYKKLKENKSEISHSKYLDRQCKTIEVLNFIEKCVKEALYEGNISFSICGFDKVKLSKKIFGNAEQYSFGIEPNWYNIKITKLGLKRLNRKLRKLYKKAGKNNGN